MNTKSAAALMGRPSEFAQMQAAELAWWKRYCAGRNARERMYALYGMRYRLLWKELETCGRTVEFGSGPMPVLHMSAASDGICVDTLMPKYIEEKLIQTPLRWTTDGSEIPDNAADTVFLLNVLDHTLDPAQMCKDAYRVLLPGGKALVFVHLENEDEKHRPVSVDDVAEWLRVAGFRIEWQELLDATDYDPRALVAVAVK